MAQPQQSDWQPPSYAIPVGGWKPPSYAVPSSGTPTPSESATPQQPPASGSLYYAKQLGRAGLNALGGVGASAIKPVSTLFDVAKAPLENLGVSPQTVEKGSNYLHQLSTPPPGIAGEAGNLLGQGAQFVAPAGLEESAAAKIGEAIPNAPWIVRGIAKAVPAAISSGTISKLQGTGFVPGAVLGAAAEPISEGMHALGGNMAARAAGVTNNQLRYGAKPGEEILGLKGIRPSTIRASASAKATALTQELESALEQSGKEVSLIPAKDEVDKAISKAANQNDLTTFKHLEPLAEQVSSLPDKAPAREALEYKRGLKTLSNFQKASPVTAPAMSAARGAYSAVDSELDKAVPKVNDLDNRIHSLITVSKPKGTGGMGLGKYILPYMAARAIEAGGGGPLGEAAGMGLTFAGESPAARIMLGKGLAKAPTIERGMRPVLLKGLKQLRSSQ